MTQYEAIKIALFFGNHSPKGSLFSGSKIKIDGKDIKVFCQPNNQEYRVAFKVNKNHDILIDLINQKLNQ